MGPPRGLEGELCPHKWLPGSAVAHLPLIPTPRLTFASSFLCSSCLPENPSLFPAPSLTLSPPTAHVYIAGTGQRAGHAYLFLDIFGPPREIHTCTRSSTNTTCIRRVSRDSRERVEKYSMHGLTKRDGSSRECTNDC